MATITRMVHVVVCPKEKATYVFTDIYEARMAQKEADRNCGEGHFLTRNQVEIKVN